MLSEDLGASLLLPPSISPFFAPSCFVTIQVFADAAQQDPLGVGATNRVPKDVGCRT